MDFELPEDDHPTRLAIRAWLAAHPSPGPRELAEAGYVAPHWPRPWGLDADPITQIVIDQELKRARVSVASNPIGTGWAGPTLLVAGTSEQKDRYLMPMLSGEEGWCQLFSEPDAGSDLAGLSTRAVRDGDCYVVEGQKIWTSYGHQAHFGILLARTDPDVPKREGITYLICPMDAEGITVTPIVDMTGMHTFNQVFLDGVRIPVANRVGEEGQGWSLAKVTLANERISLSGGGAIWGAGPTVQDLVELVRASGGCSDPLLRQRLASLYARARILDLIRYRTVTAAIQGREPGPEISVRKLMSDELGQELFNLAKDLAGASGMLTVSAPGPQGGEGDDFQGFQWGIGFLFSPALTVGGGTAQVQRNIIAERALGLPREAGTS